MRFESVYANHVYVNTYLTNHLFTVESTMKQLLSDWRVLSGIAILGWGLWGIMSKLALKELDWRVMLLFSSIASLPLVLTLGLGAFDWKFDKYVYLILAGIAGLGASCAALAFNRALQKGGPANQPTWSYL